MQCNLQLVDLNGEWADELADVRHQWRTTAAINPEILNGWSVRPADWQIGASIQQELMPRMSVEVGYFRRWLTNFTTTDNESLTAVDFDLQLYRAQRSTAPGRRGYAISGRTT